MAYEASFATSRLCIVFSSEDQRHVDRAAAEIGRFLTDAGICVKMFDIMLLVREGLNNAARHGNRLSEERLVRFECGREDPYLVLSIEDEGEGFDWRTRTERESVHQEEGGRGLPIMQEYASEVVFNEKGNRLILKIRIQEEVK